MNSNYITASSYQVAAVGGTYAIGPALVGLTYSNTQYGNVASLGGVSPKFNDVEAGVRWQFTPLFFAGLAYNYTTSTGVKVRGATLGNQHYHQVSVLADYFLSKRSDVYFTAAVQEATGVSSTGSAAAANIGGLGDSSNNRQAVMRVALRHRF